MTDVMHSMSISSQLFSGMTPPSPRPLRLQIGFEMHFELPAPTTLVLGLFVRPEEASQLDAPERLVVDPETPVEIFEDGFGNRFGRLTGPAGILRVSHRGVYRCLHEPEAQPSPDCPQQAPGELPHSVLPYLLGSRYCEIDRLSAVAWDLFGKLPSGGARALAVNRWVFENIKFGYRLTRPNKTALDTYVERTGVCRDMAHLAIAFCRALNIPARYGSGYLGDIDADPDPTPMDFSAFMEVYLGGRWWTMDPRHGRARVGRVAMTLGRDATDVALVTSFGRHRLVKFEVATDPITDLKLTPAAEMPLALSA